MSKLIVVNIQYTIKSDSDIYTVKILCDSYEAAEFELRKLVLSQLKKRSIQANLDDCISVSNRSIYTSIDFITPSVKKLLANKAEL